MPRFLPIAALLFVLPGSAQAAESLVDHSAAWFDGEDDQDLAGLQVSAAGDLNGDGLNEFLIASPGYQSGTGKVYVFPGLPYGWSSPLNPGLALARITGQHEADNFGQVMAPTGDVNGDGFDDILLSAFTWYPSEGNTAGGIALVLGRSYGETWPSLLTAADAFFTGPDNSQSGRAVTGLGDVDGDGFDDFAIGSPYADHEGTNEGAVFVYYGGEAMDGGTLAAAPTILYGEADNDTFGTAVQGVGDVDGDGFPDLVVGAPDSDVNGSKSGTLYLFSGGARWPAEVTVADAVAVIRGDEENRQCAANLARPTDFNGDGWMDLVIGDRHPDLFGGVGVAVFIFQGGPGGALAQGGEFTLNQADAVAVEEGGTDAGRGTPVDLMGDQNGDGKDDLIIGFEFYGELSGAGVLALGRDFEAGNQVMADVEVYAGEVCGGANPNCGDFAGRAAAGIGDVDGDGQGDALLGAPDRDEENTNGGRAYVLTLGPAATDDDGDGQTEQQGDCDDSNPAILMDSEAEDGCDGVDSNCNGVIDEDCVPETDDDTSAAADDDSAADDDGDPDDCGCSASPSSRPLTPWLLALLLAGATRRRSSPPSSVE